MDPVVETVQNLVNAGADIAQRLQNLERKHESFHGNDAALLWKQLYMGEKAIAKLSKELDGVTERLQLVKSGSSDLQVMETALNCISRFDVARDCNVVLRFLKGRFLAEFLRKEMPWTKNAAWHWVDIKQFTADPTTYVETKCEKILHTCLMTNVAITYGSADIPLERLLVDRHDPCDDGSVFLASSRLTISQVSTKLMSTNTQSRQMNLQFASSDELQTLIAELAKRKHDALSSGLHGFLSSTNDLASMIHGRDEEIASLEIKEMSLKNELTHIKDKCVELRRQLDIE